VCVWVRLRGDCALLCCCFCFLLCALCLRCLVCWRFVFVCMPVVLFVFVCSVCLSWVCLWCRCLCVWRVVVFVCVAGWCVGDVGLVVGLWVPCRVECALLCPALLLLGCCVPLVRGCLCVFDCFVFGLCLLCPRCLAALLLCDLLGLFLCVCLCAIATLCLFVLV